MPRPLKNKELVNTRLATNYGGWMYCDACGENIGYLCYSTYDRIDLEYQCLCGSRGKVAIDFEDSRSDAPSSNNDAPSDNDSASSNSNDAPSSNTLTIIKNRLCCPDDHEPLITLLDKKLAHYDLKITCKSCGNVYQKTK